MYRYHPVTHSKKITSEYKTTWLLYMVLLGSYLYSFIMYSQSTQSLKGYKKMFCLTDIKYLTKTIYITKLCAWLQLFHDSTVMCKSVPCYHPRFSLPKSVNTKKQTQVIFLCYKCSILKHQLYEESMHHVILQFTFLQHYIIRQHCAEFELCDIKNC